MTHNAATRSIEELIQQLLDKATTLEEADFNPEDRVLKFPGINKVVRVSDEEYWQYLKPVSTQYPDFVPLNNPMWELDYLLYHVGKWQGIYSYFRNYQKGSMDFD